MLDATVGSATANSYVTIQEATAYFTDRTFITVWDSFDDQSAALVTATNQLSWYVSWLGNRVDNVQSLDWPRTDVSSKFGTEYGIAEIPREVKEAVFELALSSLEADRTSDSDLAGLSMVQAGPLVIKTDDKDQNSDARQPLPSKIWNIISHLTESSGLYNVRLGRA